MARGYRLQSNPLVGKLTTKYLLPLGTRQVGDDLTFLPDAGALVGCLCLKRDHAQTRVDSRSPGACAAD